jgi:hypothetical protein
VPATKSDELSRKTQPTPRGEIRLPARRGAMIIVRFITLI